MKMQLSWSKVTDECWCCDECCDGDESCDCDFVLCFFPQLQLIAVTRLMKIFSNSSLKTWSDWMIAKSPSLRQIGNDSRSTFKAGEEMACRYHSQKRSVKWKILVDPLVDPQWLTFLEQIKSQGKRAPCRWNGGVLFVLWLVLVAVASF